MKYGYFLVASIAAMAACVPYQGYYREGAPVARFNADLTDCQVRAVRRVPPNTQIRSTPILTTPMHTICEDGDCTTYGGLISGGQTYSYDANEGLRDRVEAQCMSRRGYATVELPLCPAPVTAEQLRAAPRLLPRLSEGVCAARLSDGSYVFLTAASG